MTRLLHECARTRPLVCDGAMGTELMRAGLEPGACCDAWSLTHGEHVAAIHRRYVEAGADCLIANTFGASRPMLRRRSWETDFAAINAVSVALARRALGHRPGFVLGDIGPLGVTPEPFGGLHEIDARRALTEQAHALVDAGADAIIIETQTTLEELGLAIDAAKAAGAPTIIASLAFNVSESGTRFATRTGVSPEQAATMAEERGAHVIALNCGIGLGMREAADVAARFRSACSLPVMVQPNAGQPVPVPGGHAYSQTPIEMARAVPAVLAAGASIVGSCCGSTPEHTRAIRHALDAQRREAG